MQKNVCAIIVTWNSGREIERSLPAIAPQVAETIIVDNGSSPENFLILKEAAGAFNSVTILKNEKNEGIAAALNRGARYAMEKGYEWMVTLDDSGKAEENMVEKMLEAYHNLPPEHQKKTAIIAPNYTTLKGRTYPVTSPFFVPTTVTTGQLVKIAVWKEMGGYKEELFIAGVDHEFCFRILRGGYKTLLVPSSTIEETAGPAPKVHSLFGRNFVVPNYHPDRYYYTFRNDIFLYKTYWRNVPRWIIENIFSNIRTIAKIILFEDQKLKKMAAIARGCCDGLRGRYGILS